MKKFFYCLVPFIFLNLIGMPIQTFGAEIETSVEKQLADLESASGGRIGIAAVNTANNQQIQYRANESFPMQCTSKLMGVAAILKKSMHDDQLLQQRLSIKKTDLTGWNPITKNHLNDGMTVAELCAAAISYSDNAAMNLLAKKLGGPAGINSFARSIGDTHFKLDHWWPEEALASPESLDDSSTPFAMNESLRKLALENVLNDSKRKMLISWLKSNTTGDHRIRASLPTHWKVGDKTGTGSYGATNDIAVIWPSNCAPMVVTIFYSSNKKDASHREDILASATKIIMNEFARTDHCIQIKS